MTVVGDESRLRRDPPPSPFRATGLILSVSSRAVAQSTALMRAAGRIESCCFWLGERDSVGNGIVHAVVAPRQRGTWGNYLVDADAMMQVAEAFADRGWRNLAQLHSHPGAGVEHSRYDDQMASSRRALSLVFPWYGDWSGPWPAGIGVHEYIDSYWHLLSGDEAVRRVRIAREDAGALEVVDFR